MKIHIDKFLVVGAAMAAFAGGVQASQPNILIAITDDQSWEHVGAYGASWINTPNIDTLANEGLLFTQAYCQVPSCSPSRATLLTGRHPWQLDEGATLWSTVPARYPTLMDVLAEAGYHTGYTRKGWGPGSDTLGGRSRNPAGRSYSSFSSFNSARSPGQPFCFWFGTQDPHRPYSAGSGLASGRHTLADVIVPGFLPDHTTVRSDLLDYGYEIERFDSELGSILTALQSSGELDNTIVLITSDNGLPFPGAKSNLYDHGVRVPLIVRWPGNVPQGVQSNAFVVFADIMPTLLEAVGAAIPDSVTGLSHWARWMDPAGAGDPVRDWAPLYLTRHSHCRYDMQGYPMRGIRTHDYLYIRNYEPDRWPSGDPPSHLDIDGGPTKSLLYNLSATYPSAFARCFSKRPAEELYDMAADPYSMDNLAEDPSYAAIKASLREQLTAYLHEQVDPLVLGYGFLLEGNPYTRSSFNETFGGVELLGRYHTVRLAEFEAWLADDVDLDAIPNLIELALRGYPQSPESSVGLKLDASGLQIPKKAGVWPWRIDLLPVMDSQVSETFLENVIRVDLPVPGNSVLFRISTTYEFSAP